MRSKKYFNLREAKGYHVTPVQFYESVPDTGDLKEIYLKMILNF